LRTRFFRPLGLDHTTFQAVDAPAGPLAHGYRFTGADPALPAIDLSDGSDVVPFTSVITAAGAAGSIATTADDLAHWARALYGGSALPPEALAAMLADVDRTARLKPAIAYGLGVQAVEADGHRAFGHSGRLLGFRAVARFLPDDGVAIAVLTNQSRTDPNLIVRDLLRIGLQPHGDCFICRLSQ
jgi:D-alanyl-D-alanine carboxypeptidase